MIHIKPGVRVHSLCPEMMIVLVNANELWRERGAELVITSVLDGRHRRGSKHFVGYAVDLRTKNLDRPSKIDAINKLKEALGTDYDVILEAEDTPNEHLHVEFDPKEAL